MDDMTTPDGTVAGDLRQLIAQGQISEETLSVVTRIELGRLSALLADDVALRGGLVASEPMLSPEETTRLSTLTAQLAYGLDVDDDERLQGILESLMVECCLSLENIARLTGLHPDDLLVASTAPQELTSDTKYAIALRASYLVNAVNRASRT